jgi:methionyl-tRNA formyltransferase
LNALALLRADLFVVVAFRMLPEIVWAMPRLGSVNLHGSLLPNLRGAAPIHWAIFYGLAETGLTTFQLRQEIDTGDILGRVSLPIPPRATTGELHDLMAPLGASLLVETVEKLQAGTASPLPQAALPDAFPAPKLSKEMAEIVWGRPADELDRHIRGFAPQPGAYTFWAGKLLKIFFAEPIHIEGDRPPVGTAGLLQNQVVVQTGAGALLLGDVQLEGRRRMPAEEAFRGRLLAPILLGR